MAVGLCGHSTITLHRGCCRTCYARFQRAVHEGKDSWEHLEAEGKVVAPKPCDPFYQKRRGTQLSREIRK